MISPTFFSYAFPDYSLFDVSQQLHMFVVSTKK